MRISLTWSCNQSNFLLVNYLHEESISQLLTARLWFDWPGVSCDLISRRLIGLPCQTRHRDEPSPIFDDSCQVKKVLNTECGLLPNKVWICLKNQQIWDKCEKNPLLSPNARNPWRQNAVLSAWRANPISASWSQPALSYTFFTESAKSVLLGSVWGAVLIVEVFSVQGWMSSVEPPVFGV